jgi:MOSC domain-containing protein YiiM
VGTTTELLDIVPGRGAVTAILLRRSHRGPVDPVSETTALAGLGLEGDRRTIERAPDPAGKRHVTLLQAEHLAVIASLTGHDRVDPVWLRRNLVVAGINLLAVRDRRFRVGDAVLEGTGACHPCVRMEEALGPGGFQAMRGHGGITARVVSGGRIAIGDMVLATRAQT